jgi:serine/threonine protein kinase
METIGRYAVEGELGRGGCGVVYLGRDLKMNRLVAIKTILTRELVSSMGGNDLQLRLIREAQSAGSLNHPAIVTVYELSEDADLTFIVMEYVDGPPLDTVMKKGPVPWPRLIEILREIGAGLDFAHSKGIIHRDIKPANILISSAGHAKISDFGVAKMIESAAMTSTGMAIGTPAYMSPEQILTKPLDGRADQFSLAVLAFEMLAGRRPFESDSLPGLIHQILAVEPPRADVINAEVSGPVAGILCRALSKEATARYGTCTEFIRALAEALVPTAGTLQIPITTAAQITEIKGTAIAPRTGGNVVRGILVLALSLAVATYIYSRGHPVQVAPAAASPITAAEPAPTRPAPQTEAPKAVKKDEKQKAAQTAQTKAPMVSLPPAPVAVVQTKVQPADPGPDPPAISYMGSPEGRFTWSGTLPPGDRLVIVRNRVRVGTISGNGLPAGVPVQVEARPADIAIMQQPAPSNGFRLIVVNQSNREVAGFTVLWREQAH